jgi:putative ABC transport system permease protein
MSVITRGMRNAFRNSIRTASVITLLGISSALALSLLLANQAVKAKVVDLKKSAATVLTLRPAGQFGGEGGGDPLKTADVTKVQSLANVSSVGAILASGPVRVGTSAGGKFEAPTSDVSLDSSINPGTLGRRRFGAEGGTSTSGGAAAPVPDFKLPVMLTGLLGNLDREGQTYKVTSGTVNFSGTDVAEAVVGKGIAEKNNLKVGSTFVGKATTFKVVGIVDAGSEFGNDAVMIPLATMGRLSSQAGEVSEIFVKADSIDHLDGVKAAVGNALGNSRVDITSAAQNTTDAIASLATIQQISFVGMLGALGAAGVITFLIMVMTVRERRREVGVLKAIGSSNVGVVTLFVSEALVLTFCGAILGVGIAAAASQPITGALVTANTPTASSDNGGGPTTSISGPGGGGRAGGGFVQRFGGGVKSATDLLNNVKTTAGPSLLLEGLAAAIAIAVLGSAIPAFLIAKVRPAEVMRGE